MVTGWRMTCVHWCFFEKLEKKMTLLHLWTLMAIFWPTTNKCILRIWSVLFVSLLCAFCNAHLFVSVNFRKCIQLLFFNTSFDKSAFFSIVVVWYLLFRHYHNSDTKILDNEKTNEMNKKRDSVCYFISKLLTLYMFYANWKGNHPSVIDATRLPK